MNHKEKQTKALVNYIIMNDWMGANAILNKYGFPPIEKVEDMHENFAILLSDPQKGESALRDIINIDTPYRRLLLAEVQDNQSDRPTNFGGYTYGEYDTPFPRTDHEDHLVYPNSNNWRTFAETVPRTKWGEWRAGVISGSSYSGVSHYAGSNSEGVDHIDILIIITVIIGFVYFLNK